METEHIKHGPAYDTCHPVIFPSSQDLIYFNIQNQRQPLILLWHKPHLIILRKWLDPHGTSVTLLLCLKSKIFIFTLFGINDNHQIKSWHPQLPHLPYAMLRSHLRHASCCHFPFEPGSDITFHPKATTIVDLHDCAADAMFKYSGRPTWDKCQLIVYSLWKPLYNFNYGWVSDDISFPQSRARELICKNLKSSAGGQEHRWIGCRSLAHHYETEMHLNDWATNHNLITAA